MGKSVKSFFDRNYRIGLFLSVLVVLLVFGFVAWSVSASNGESAPEESTDAPAQTQNNTGVAPGQIDFFATRAQRAYEERLREKRGLVANEEESRGQDGDETPVKDSPPDTKHYWRPIVAADRIPLPQAPAALQSVVVDAVVSNTNPNLQNTDTAGDTENNIAINPLNPNEIVMTGFSGSWGANAPLWHSLDGGATWTEQQSIPVPTGFGGGCPCDQSIDYGRGNRMSGTFLKTDVFSGTTTNPALSASWNWLVSGGSAQRTNSSGVGNVDQPWLLVNRDPTTPSQDNVYVAYDDFSTNPVDMRVARSAGTNPPNFTTDVKTGSSGGGINPGHRLANDPGNGWIYDTWQVSTGGDNTARTINYMLNRSTDGGATWTVNGSSTGTQIASASSTQPCNKFGGVNALLGGVEHAGVDPNNGALYYAYGNRDGSGNNRIAIRRVTDAGGGNITIGAESFVTTTGQAAIPSVAVNSDGVVAVFYYTSNGIVGGFPQFTARVALSTDNGATFPAAMNTALETFASVANDDGGLCGSGQSNQRVLGDYMETKAVGKAFFGSFNGNGVPFGRTVSNHDPIFYKISLVQSNTTTSVTSSTGGTSVSGQPVTFNATVTSTGGIVTSTVNFLDGATPIAGCQNIPLNAGLAQCPNISNLSTGAHTINVNYIGDVQFSASTGSVAQLVTKAATTTTITSDNPDPSVFGQTFPVNFTVVADPPGVGTPTGNVIVTVSGGAETCTGTVAAGTCNIQLNGVGARTLTATYQGNTNFLGSSDTEAHQVDKASTTTALASSVNPSVFGQPVTFTATISVTSPGAGTPTGNVTFKDGGVNIATCAAQPVVLNVATCTISTFSVGTHPITATYNGDANFNGSISNTVNQVVNKADTTTTVTAVPASPSTFGQSVTFTATVAAAPPGMGTPTGTVTFNIDGNLYCVNTPLTNQGGFQRASCTQAGLPALPAGLRNVVAIYSGDMNFNGSAGTLNYTVNKANTTTAITSDVPDPSLVNQPYTVTWTVTAVAPGAGTPTGTVTVNGGVGGGTCTAPTTDGGCQLTPTTIGVKTIQATFNGDANFNGSVSPTTTHTVNVGISGTVRNGITLAPVAGETMFLQCASPAQTTTTTDAAGQYTFSGLFTGPCRLFPNTFHSEPFIRNYPSLPTNITGADFLLYANAGEFPRKLTFPTQYVTPGQAGSMPVIMNSQDNEASVAFSFTYNTNALAQPPTVTCGANAPGCTVVTNTSTFGSVGVTITPAGGTFRLDGEVHDAGLKEIARINFQTVANSLPSVDFVFTNAPTQTRILDPNGHDLLGIFVTPARIVFAQGIEGDVATRNAGNGTLEAADVVQMRRFVTNLDTMVTTHNEFQRADTAPASTRGDGSLNATDLVQVRRYVAGLDASQGAAGAGAPNPAPIAPPAAERTNGDASELLIGNTNALNNARVSVPVNFRANGSEAAMSFTLRYDAGKLADPRAELAAGLPDGVTLTSNAKEPGAIRLLIDATTTLAYASKDGQALIDLSFAVRETSPSGDAYIEVEDLVVSDAAATNLTAKATRGTISITGSNPADTGAKLGGLVQIEETDLVEEWLGGSIVVLRPRLDGETIIPTTRPIQ